MIGNYFFIDGSALTAQIRQLQRADPKFRKRKLCPIQLIKYLMHRLPDLHGAEYKRAVLYFPTGEEAAVEQFIRMPDHKKPGEVRDLHFKFCGHKLKKSAEFDKFVEKSVPTKYHDRFQKSEKGIDIEICCDALRLATTGRLERLFLLSNDGDFIPLCRTLKEFGANISILHLSDVTVPNHDLLRESDSYDVVDRPALEALFFPQPGEDGDGPCLPLGDAPVGEGIDAEREPPEPRETEADGEPQSEKPDAAPSDLNTLDGSANPGDGGSGEGTEAAD